MRSIATSLLTLAVAVLLLGPSWAQAQQAEPLGDEFVFFVEGVNPAVPTAGANAMVDPNDADNTVLAFPGGSYANPSLSWDASVGVDASQNQADGDTLFMKLRTGAEAGTPDAHGNVYFMLLDSESLNNDGDPNNDDIAFRAIWPLPDSLFDGEWHDLVIPLPPATVEDMRNIDTTAFPITANWNYQGGYNPDGALFATPGSEAFEEFSWDAVYSFGFFWDQSSGTAGTIYIDDWYIGSVNTDLSPFQGAGDPYDGTVTATHEGDGEVDVSFTQQDGAGGYRVYIVSEEGADVADATEAQLVRRFPADATDLSLDYKVFAPHPSVPNPSITFAVTSESGSGIENRTPVYATATVENAPPQGFVFEMTEDEVDGLFDAFINQTLTTDFVALDDVWPFRMGPEHGTLADLEGDIAVTTEEDFSTEIYVGYAADPEAPDETIVMVYADVTDDALYFDADDGTGAPASAEAYLYDRLAMYFGVYPVDFTVGSPNTGIGPGEDVTLNFQPVSDEESNITVWPSAAASTLFSTPLFEYKMDASNNPTGWRMLAAFLMSDLNTDETQYEFTRPAEGEIDYHPVIFAYDEQDGQGGLSTRTSAVTSQKANVNFANPGWYASAQQWASTAWVDGAVSTVDAEDEVGLPGAFALKQNYPNPFAGQTAIAFTLPQSETVRLEVFNVLGQRVAEVVPGERFGAGTHEVAFDAADLGAGVFFYRIEAGDFRSTRQMILLK